MTKKLKIAVVLGSVREGRQGIKAARYIVNELKKRGHHILFIDPLEYPLPLLEKRYKEFEQGKAPHLLEKLHTIFLESDAIVLVSAEYNHSIPPALSNMLDYFMEEFTHKPSAIVSYSGGTFGGVRAAVQLREMVAELGMPSIPKVLAIVKVHEAFDNDGNDLTKMYEDRTQKFLEELEWYAHALKNHSAKSP